MRNYTIFAAVMKQKLAILLSVIFSLSVFSVSGQDTIMLSDNLRLIKTCSEYIIDYWPSEILFDTLENNGEMFYRSGFADMSHVEYTEEPGFPELPIYSVSLQVPREGCEVNVYMEPDVFDFCGGNDGEATSSSEWCSELEEQNYCIPVPDNMLYYPTQSCFGETECPTEMDYGYYYNYDTSWMSMRYYYDTIPVPYMVFGSVTFNILPLHYNPEDNCLRQMPATRFVISPSCGDDLCQLEWETLQNPVWGQDAVDFFDNYVGDEYDVDEAGIRIEDYPDEEHSGYTTLNTTYKGDYLIIVQDEYKDDMEDFVEHKVYYGYHVVTLTLSATEAEGLAYATANQINTGSLSLAEKIRYAIKGRKEDDEYLKYVLLVSEENVIPISEGYTFTYWGDNDITNPPTDIFYESLNTHSRRNTHLFPELYIGRWIITNSLNLANIIYKTTTTEITQYLKRVALFSGTGNMQNMFYRANKHISQYLLSTSITVTNIDGRTNPSVATIWSTFSNEATWMWIYNGHGNINLLGSPYLIHSYDVINNNVFTPFAFGFACLLNTYHDYGTGALLLRSSDTFGSTTFYGASTESYGLSNKKLSKRIFSQMVKNTDISIGQMIIQGERKYYDACRTSCFKQRMVKMYNLFGDPSLPLQGLDESTGVVRPFFAPKYYNSEYNFDNNDTISGIELYDITGKKVKTSMADAYQLPNGVYIKTTYTSNGVQSNKIHIHH